MFIFDHFQQTSSPTRQLTLSLALAKMLSGHLEEIDVSISTTRTVPSYVNVYDVEKRMCILWL